MEHTDLCFWRSEGKPGWRRENEQVSSFIKHTGNPVAKAMVFKCNIVDTLKDPSEPRVYALIFTTGSVTTAG
jgi:hypothetical protein